MPRRRVIGARKILADPKYRSETVAKFINYIMLDGKKTIAEKLVYQALDTIASKAKKPALEVFQEALDSIAPMVEVRSRRVGGATYQVPVEVRPIRRMALSMRWLVEAARARKEHTMAERVANELLEAVENRGNAFKKKEEVHRMAEANKAFSHFRF